MFSFDVDLSIVSYKITAYVVYVLWGLQCTSTHRQSWKTTDRVRSKWNLWSLFHVSDLKLVGSCNVVGCLCVLIRTHLVQWDGQDGTAWQPGQPGTQTQHHPSARHVGFLNDVLLNCGRLSLCNEDSLQRKKKIVHLNHIPKSINACHVPKDTIYYHVNNCGQFELDQHKLMFMW